MKLFQPTPEGGRGRTTQKSVAGVLQDRRRKSKGPEAQSGLQEEEPGGWDGWSRGSGRAAEAQKVAQTQSGGHWETLVLTLSEMEVTGGF